MSNRLTVDRITPTLQNAKSLLEFTAEDLIECGVTAETAAETANPGKLVHQVKQLMKLRRHPERYLGVSLPAERGLGHQALDGFLKYGEWGAADQAVYEGEEERQRLLAGVEKGQFGIPGQPIGIFALHVASRYPIDTRLEMADALLDELMARTHGRQIRAGLHEDEPLMPAFEAHKFYRTEATGYPLAAAPDYQTETYVAR